MNQTKKTETLHFTADAFNTDFKRELSYEVLGRNLLNSAENHASLRGFGFNDLLKAHHSWVLSRLTIEMTKMPPIYTDYNVTTWIESIYRLFTNRNFAITDNDGNVFGYARTIWAMIDNTTRQPLELMKIYGKQFDPFLAPELTCDMQGHCRLRPLPDSDPLETITTRYSDLDCNGHFNSVKYISHILDLFSCDFHLTHRIHRMELAYIAEAYYGDSLSLFLAELEPNKYQAEIKKNHYSDNKGETIARAQIEFSSCGDCKQSH